MVSRELFEYNHKDKDKICWIFKKGFVTLVGDDLLQTLADQKPQLSCKIIKFNYEQLKKITNEQYV